MHAKLLQSCLMLCDSMDYSQPESTGFSRQEYWSGLPCPPPRDIPDPGIEPAFPMSPALAGGFFTTSATWEAPLMFSSGQSLSRVQLFATPWITLGNETRRGVNCKGGSDSFQDNPSILFEC